MKSVNVFLQWMEPIMLFAMEQKQVNIKVMAAVVVAFRRILETLQDMMVTM